MKNPYTSEEPICAIININDNDLLPRIRNSHEAQIYLSQNGSLPKSKNIRKFCLDKSLLYEPFCDDFGPMSISSILGFVEIFYQELIVASRCQRDLVFCVESGPRPLTNAIFLLGAFLMLRLNKTTSSIVACFKGISVTCLESYRDASWSPATFRLTLIDCWKGLEQGKNCGWIALPSKDLPAVWGQIDRESYEHYDNPLNSDLHEVVPQRLVVFRSPKDLNGQEYENVFQEGSFAVRDFSPEYYLEILKALKVVAVVSLNQADYDVGFFEMHDIRHFELECEDNVSTPSAKNVSRFFKIMDEFDGCVAIHGGESLGRTGTLVALYLMRNYGFSAREAIAWVRIMRPGSIIGSQQQYLCNVEAAVQNYIDSISKETIQLSFSERSGSAIFLAASSVSSYETESIGLSANLE